MSALPQIEFPHVRVHDAMHPGIISAEPDTPLRAVARMMAKRRVHAIAVTGLGRDHRRWGIVSALDVAAAAASGIAQTAGEAASTEVVTISAREPLDHAAQLMAEYELTHLVVVDPASGRPIGVLSTLDVAAVYGG